MLFNKVSTVVAVMLSLTLQTLAQGPNDSGTYYQTADGAKGKALKTALSKIISPHDEHSYKQLWEDFYTTDRRPDGKVWDMYSSATSYEMGGPEQGANYKKEGDSYNREHSFPKSWFDDGKPMYTDLHHIVPTDGYVNNRRGNLPFGETDNPKYQSEGGFSKVGSSSVDGYSGDVFEPADEYKGDFARIYFYMATCYEDRIAGWNSPMLSGDSYPAYAPWALTMLLRWAEEDPVSKKETDRNNAVWTLQHNRNPYVDYPGLEQYVWGAKEDEAFSYDHYGTADDITTVVPAQTGRRVVVYSISGVAVTTACDTSTALDGLPAGVYILGGRKLAVR